MHGDPIEIFVEVTSENKSFSKSEIEYRLYGSRQFKIYHLCFRNENKIKKIDTRDIKGFMFGGISSRFWFAKNIINLMDRSEELPPEMQCWNMISIQISLEKAINLIIPN